jgi:O-antigen ligase
VKWLALIVCLAGVVPLAAWLRQNPRETPKIWMLAGFLPFLLDEFHLYMAVDSWRDWGGYVKGAEISVLDVLALALYLSLPATRYPLPFKLSMALYFLAVLLSALRAEVPVAALFYAWQLARMFLIYAVVARGVCADQRIAPALLAGAAAGLIMEAGVGIWQRWDLNVIQSGGTIGAQNLLGLISHFIVFPFFALLLTGPAGWVPPLAVLSGVVVEALTTSRATIGLAGVGFGVLFIISALRRWTSRKLMIMVGGLVVIAVAAPLVVHSFDQRAKVNDFDSSDYERTAYNNAAAMMLSDHPLGVGANQFTLIANIEGYYVKAGVPPDFLSLAGRVHNVYWLVAAETGYLGLITFVLVLLRPLTVAFLCGWRCRKDKRGDLLLGFGVGLTLVYIHSFFEWSLVTFQAQYVLSFAIGSVAGVAQQLGYWQSAQARKYPLGPGSPIELPSSSPNLRRPHSPGNLVRNRSSIDG